MSKPSPATRTILTRATNALRSGQKVTVDGVAMAGIRFTDYGTEVQREDLIWIPVKPNFLHIKENGDVEIETAAASTLAGTGD